MKPLLFPDQNYFLAALQSLQKYQNRVGYALSLGKQVTVDVWQSVIVIARVDYITSY